LSAGSPLPQGEFMHLPVSHSPYLNRLLTTGFMA
jgi:hypothetical protein